MPNWDRAIDLFVNVGTSPEWVLLASKSSLSPAERPLLVTGDKHLVRLWLVQPGAAGAAPSLLSLAVGDVVVLAGKTKASSPDLLFSATGFVVNAEGGTHYEALLDLTAQALIDALGDETALTVTCEVEIQNSTNSQRRTRQFPVRVNRGVYTNESDPEPSEPAYPSADALALKAPVNSTYRIKEDVAGVYLQLKNRDTGKFHTLFAAGADGAAVLALDPNGQD